MTHTHTHRVVLQFFFHLIDVAVSSMVAERTTLVHSLAHFLVDHVTCGTHPLRATDLNQGTRDGGKLKQGWNSVLCRELGHNFPLFHTCARVDTARTAASGGRLHSIKYPMTIGV